MASEAIIDVTSHQSQGFREHIGESDKPDIKVLIAEAGDYINLKVNGIDIQCDANTLAGKPGYAPSIKLNGIELPRVRKIDISGEVGKPWIVKAECVLLPDRPLKIMDQRS